MDLAKMWSPLGDGGAGVVGAGDPAAFLWECEWFGESVWRRGGVR